MHVLHKLFAAAHLLLVALFFGAALALLGLAGIELWQAVSPGSGLDSRGRFDTVLECVGILTIALVSLELGQTIFEEEVQRDVKVSGPTRVRRFLSRFLVVIVVALSIETLVSVFQLLHDDPAKLPYTAASGTVAALLLVAWGVFIRLNRSAEELEPEAMAAAKEEDRKVEGEAAGSDGDEAAPARKPRAKRGSD